MENKEFENLEVTEAVEEVISSEALSQKKTLSKEKKKIILWGAVALLVVIAVLAVSLYIKSDKVGKALDSSQYNRVQLTINQTVTFLDTEDEEEDASQSESTDIYGDNTYLGEGEYYYDENGNLVTEDEAEGQEQQSNTTSQDICVLKKDGDVYYEKSLGEYYQYDRDGESFILYYDDFYGINEENPDWIEVYAENYGSLQSFDFKIFDNYEKSDFKKEGDHYVPKEDVTDFFYEFLQIKQVEKYNNCDIEFYFENGKISKIVASYLYDNSMDIVQTYKFSYKDEAIKIPAATIKYDKDGNKIDLKADGETKK